MLELARVAAPQATCGACGGAGLCLQADSDSDWPEAPRCGQCGAAIPAERLEVFPNAELCAACQAASDAGRVAPAADYCPRCGSAMQVRPMRGAGVTRYRLTCSRWPECRGTA
jgi:hypothetical protein